MNPQDPMDLDLCQNHIWLKLWRVKNSKNHIWFWHRSRSIGSYECILTTACFYEASLLNKSKSEVYFVKFARKLRRTLFLVQMWWKSWFGANISPATWFLMFNLLIKSKIYLITSSGEWKIQIIIYDFDIDPDPLGPRSAF